SEGSTKKKFTQIKSNYYLLTCLRRLIKISKGLTIFGQDLNPEYDGHLIRAVKEAEKLKYIAYGVYTTDKNNDKDIEHRIEKLFRGSTKTLLFFDSRTFFDSVKEIASEKLGIWGITSFFPDTDKLCNFYTDILKPTPPY
ncbi:DUF4917 family protein, partial [Bacillus haynesii]|nr:DUF4917 family protein [Bacillus haynesii]